MEAGAQQVAGTPRLPPEAVAAFCEALPSLRPEGALHLGAARPNEGFASPELTVKLSYDAGFDGFAAPEVRGDPARRQQWAVEQMQLAAKASANLGLTAHATFSGALAWPYLYSWPPRPAGLIETAFDELARRWKPSWRR